MAQKRSVIYYRWGNMIKRCSNPNSPDFPNYGGRGIQVCARWLVYKNFENDMLKSYKKGLWLERINNDGDYEPSNCRWATPKEQQNNKRINKVITFKGITKNITQWAEYLGIKSSTLRQRYYVYKWSVDKCFMKGVA